VNAAEVTAVGKAKDTATEFERYVNMNVLRLAVCAGDQLSGGAEPQEPAIEAKVGDEVAAIQFEQQVFTKRVAARMVCFCADRAMSARDCGFVAMGWKAWTQRFCCRARAGKRFVLRLGLPEVRV